MKYSNGLDYDEYMDRFIAMNLEKLKDRELETLARDKDDIFEDEESYLEEVNAIKSIRTAEDYRNSSCWGADMSWLEELFAEWLREKYQDCKDGFAAFLKSLCEDKNIEVIESKSHSWSSGLLVSCYFELSIEDDEDVYSRKIRFCDGHDNGRNDDDLEILFQDLERQGVESCRIDVEDLIDDLLEEAGVE